MNFMLFLNNYSQPELRPVHWFHKSIDQTLHRWTQCLCPFSHTLLANVVSRVCVHTSPSMHTICGRNSKSSMLFKTHPLNENPLFIHYGMSHVSESQRFDDLKVRLQCFKEQRHRSERFSLKSKHNHLAETTPPLTKLIFQHSIYIH